MKASGDKVRTGAWRGAGKPDPLILLMAQEPLLRASVEASVPSLRSYLAHQLT